MMGKKNKIYIHLRGGWRKEGTSRGRVDECRGKKECGRTKLEAHLGGKSTFRGKRCVEKDKSEGTSRGKIDECRI